MIVSALARLFGIIPPVARQPARIASAAPRVTAAPKTFVFTGALSMSRADARNRAQALGHRVGTYVSRNTDYVVVGKGAGSRLERAVLLGTPQITEQQFLQLLAREVS